MIKLCFEKSIIILIYLAFVVITLAFSTETQNLILAKEIIGGSILLLICLLFIAYKIEFNIEYENNFILHYPFIFLIVSIIITTIITDFKYRSALWLSHYLTIIISVYAMIFLIEKFKDFYLIFKTINITTIIAGVYAVLQNFNCDFFVDWGMSPVPLTSTFGCCCGVRLYFLTFLPIIIISILYAKSKNDCFLSVLALISAIGASVNEYQIPSLKSFLYSVIIFFIYVFVYKESRLIKLKPRFFYPISFIIIIVLLFASVFTYEIKSFDYPSFKVRKIIWKGAANGIRDKPLLGHGIGTFQIYFPYNRASNYHRYGVSHNTMWAQNDIIETFHDIGIIGASFYFLCLALAIFSLLQIMLKTEERKIYYSASLFILSIIGFYSISMHKVQSKWFYGVYYFWFIIGLSQIWLKSVMQTNQNDF